MKLHVIDAGNLKLDGGAMFGVVPKKLWERTNPADEKNRIELTVRCLLIEDGNRKILIDTGLGSKQSEKFFGFYDWKDPFKIIESLHKLGITPEDITDIFLTHLHFDHCGGVISNDEKGKPQLTFPNAAVWSHSSHWDWAITPNAREKASFLKENLLPIQESGNLRFADHGHDLPFEWLTVDGHTEAQMLPMIKIGDQTLLFAADLLPTVGHIPLPFVMSYDVRPLKTLEEREEWFTKAAEENWHIFLEHDAFNECCSLKQTEKGIQLNQTYLLSDLNL